MDDFDKYEFERYIRDDIDGRLYWEDLMGRVIDGRVISKAFEAYKEGDDDIRAESWSEGYEEGYNIGYDEGFAEAESDDSSAYDDGYSEGYAQAEEDLKSDAKSLPTS